MTRYVVCASCGYERQLAEQAKTVVPHCLECRSLKVSVTLRPRKVWAPTLFDVRFLRSLRIART